MSSFEQTPSSIQTLAVHISPYRTSFRSTLLAQCNIRIESCRVVDCVNVEAGPSDNLALLAGHVPVSRHNFRQKYSGNFGKVMKSAGRGSDEMTFFFECVRELYTCCNKRPVRRSSSWKITCVLYFQAL